MVSIERIQSIILEKLETDNYFLVEVKEKPPGNFVVFIDSNSGVPIEYCVELSRYINNTLNIDEENFGLEVSSPGLGQPLKIPRQYHKCSGRPVEAILKSGIKIKGELSDVTDTGFVIKEQKLQKPSGGGKKELEIIEHRLTYNEIKSVKELIKF